jgi:hypothetical protein
VRCSGDSRSDPEGELHTGFRLSSNGEHLRLSRPDGTVEWQWSPFFPAQAPDISYGYPQTVESTSLLWETATGRALVPLDGSLGLEWTLPEFDDSGWIEGSNGFGFDRKNVPTYLDVIGTDLEDVMSGVNASAYVRYSFSVPENLDLRGLAVRLRFEDGIVVYRENLNGDAPAWDSRAARSRSSGLVPLNVNVSLVEGALRPGANVLAVHGLNSSSTGNDFFVLAEVLGLPFETPELFRPQFFESPSPGWPNGQGVAGLGPEPIFGVSGGTFALPVTVEITSNAAVAEIRYTTDGSRPNLESPLYESPLTFDRVTRLRARVFTEGALPGRTAEAVYVVMDPALESFSSNLPVVMVNTFGRSPNTSNWTDCHMTFLDRGPDGRTRLTDAPQYAGIGGIEIRGSSSVGQSETVVQDRALE